MTMYEKQPHGGPEKKMQDLTEEPDIDLVIDEDGSWEMLTGDELFAHRYEQWMSRQVDTTHPAAVPPSNEYRIIPRANQFWDRRFQDV